MTMLPGFQQQLEQRAEQMAAEQAKQPVRKKRWWRSRRGLGISILVAGIAAGGGAYAGKGLWQPESFNPNGPLMIPSATPPPAEQLAMLALLRRDQTEADRSLAARYVLSGANGDVVRTPYIRTVAKLPDGSTVILVPVARRGGQHAMDRVAGAPRKDVLCLEVVDKTLTMSGTTGCATTGDLASGRLRLAQGTQPTLTPRQTKRLAKAQSKAWRPGGTGILPPKYRTGIYADRIDSVGIVPDAVASVRTIVDGSPQMVPVRGNAYVTNFQMGDHVEWIGRDGRPVPQLQPMGLELLPLPAEPGKDQGLVRDALRDYQDAFQARQQKRNDAQAKKENAEARAAAKRADARKASVLRDARRRGAEAGSSSAAPVVVPPPSVANPMIAPSRQP